MSDHRRKSERSELTTAITIKDAFSDEIIGELVNITTEGMMIIANLAIETHSIFQYKLVLPTTIQGLDELEIGVDCLWCREAENFNRHWAGFQIIDAAESTTNVIAELIQNFGKSADQ